MASESAKTSALGAVARRLSILSTSALPCCLPTTALSAFQKWISANLPAMSFLANSPVIRLGQSSTPSPLLFFATALLTMA